MANLNSAVSRRAIEEIVIRGDVHALDDLLASDFVGHCGNNRIVDRDGFRKRVTEVIEGFSDRQISIEDQLVDGDKVITRWKMMGTHSSMFRGASATGQQITMVGICIDRIAGGKIVESWQISDDAGLMHQLEQVKEPATTAR
jgi:predicted ester cyclase